MALGKKNSRIRSHMGDNGYLKFGDSPAWVQFGKSNRWKVVYEIENKSAVMADETEVILPSIRRASIEIDIAQTHPEEVALIDALRTSPTIEFWGDGAEVDGDPSEFYIPELVVGGGIEIETPAGDNMKILLKLGIQPQSALVSGVGTDLPTVSVQGDAVAFTGNNEFFAYFVAEAA